MPTATSDKVKEAKETLQTLMELSQLLCTGLDPETLTTCVRLCEAGVNPATLATVVKQLRISGNNNTEQSTS